MRYVLWEDKERRSDAPHIPAKRRVLLRKRFPSVGAPCISLGQQPIHQYSDGIELARTYKILYKSRMPPSKPVEFLGTSLDDLRAFPPSAKREVGYQIDQVQNGWEPDDWKPMKAVGQGVKEIRVHDSEGAFRVIYIAK